MALVRATVLACSAILAACFAVGVSAGVVRVTAVRDFALLALGTFVLGTMLVLRITMRHVQDQRALLESERRGRQITDAAQLAVVGYGIDGRISTWNPAATRTFGWSARDVIGLSVHDVLVPRLLRVAGSPQRGSWGYGQSRDALTWILRSPTPRIAPGVRGALARHRDGHEFHVEVSVSNTGHGARGGRVAFLHDVSARRQDDQARIEARERLVEANEQLRRADAIKSDFLAMASHELRTPLTSISGFAKTMLERWDVIGDTDKRAFMEIIDQQADRLTRLVGDLLTLGRIERGRIELRASNIDPLEGVRRALRDLELDVQLVDDWGKGDLIRFDEDHFQQVLLNLLCNAAAYGADPIVVAVEADRDGGLRLEVRDSGDGVPESFVPHLFDRFAQAAHARTSDGSVGLGLSIVYGLVEANGGYVSYERLEPRGSIFRVSMSASATVPSSEQRVLA
ncbi:MAG: sensor signal transduction histidine kinase [Thermoleophilia bacterium]|nr:sensor signal transduction histidine kinase [Thermoleophilia bacterium]